MSDFNPDIEFLGLRVPAGKPLAIPKFVPEDDQSGITHRPHITGVALGPKPKPGRHTVFARGNGMEAVVGTLEMGRCEQFQVDLVARDITFSHNGTSDIYLSGYNTTSAAYFDDMSEEDDDEESEEDEDVPEGVPMQRHTPLPSQVNMTSALCQLNHDCSKLYQHSTAGMLMACDVFMQTFAVVCQFCNAASYAPLSSITRYILLSMLLHRR